MKSRAATLAVVLAVGCGDSPGDATPAADADISSDAFVGQAALPTANAGLDYQLGGAYAPPAGVDIVVRDRLAPIAAGLYNICYVNGFQTQPGERSFWTDQHPDLLLRDSRGELVIDPVWNEIVLDIRTAANRTALTAIVDGWIGGCEQAGYVAVEIDNLDTYARTNGLVSEDDAVDYMGMLSAAAHGRGLAIAQKNAADVLGRRSAMATDFAIVEECNRYDECADFTAVYGAQVYVVEYRRGDFDSGCAEFPQLSIVLRDLDLTVPGDAAYVFDGC